MPWEGSIHDQEMWRVINRKEESSSVDKPGACNLNLPKGPRFTSIDPCNSQSEVSICDN